MRKLLFLVVLLLFTAPAFAASGDVYLKYYLPNSAYGATPDTQDGAVWEAGIYLEERFEWFRPYGEISTRIDTWVNDKQAFHPASVKYTLGAAFDICKSLTLKFEHMCWHHVDSDGGDGWPVVPEDHRNQQYNRIELIYRFGGD